MYNKKQTSFGRLMSLTRPYGFWLMLRVAGAVFSAAIDIALAYMVVQMVNLSIEGDKSGLLNIIYPVAALIGGGILLSFINRYASGLIGVFAGRDIKKDITDFMGKLPVSHMETRHTGDILSLLTNDVSIIQGFLEEGLPGLIFQPLRFLGAFAFMMFVNWKLLLFSIIIIPAAMLLVNIISRPVTKFMEELQQLLGRMNSIAQDIIGGIYILKSFNLRDILFGKYKAVVDEALNRSLAVEKRMSLLGPVNVVIQIIPFVLCILYGGYLTVNGQISPGVLLAFIQMMNYLVEPLEYVPALLSSYKAAVGAANHLFEILDQQPERTDGEAYKTEPLEYPIEITNASFSYNGEKKILDCLNLKIREGEITAIAGTSGCGKSTIIKLICGFYQLQSGNIMLYRHSLDKWNLDAARGQIAVVSQDTYLYPATIAENIAYGKPGATLREVVASAKAANAHDFIMELPEGYATQVGERGTRLSGGQRQRISIARAVMKDAPILLLDEPTSALDMQSEALVGEALERFMRNRTVIIIAHRLSALKDASRVLVLDAGKIAEAGTHRELMEKDGLYRQLYIKQVFFSNGQADTDILEDAKACLT